MNGRMPISQPVFCGDLRRSRCSDRLHSSARLRPASTLAAQDQPAARSAFVVVLDAAHGGDDAGGEPGQPARKSL